MEGILLQGQSDRRKWQRRGEKQTKKAKNTKNPNDLHAYDFTVDDEKKDLSGSEDEARIGN